MTGLYALYNALGSAGTTARQQLRYRVTPPAQWADVNARLGSITGMTTIGALLGGDVGRQLRRADLTHTVRAALCRLRTLLNKEPPGHPVIHEESVVQCTHR